MAIYRAIFAGGFRLPMMPDSRRAAVICALALLIACGKGPAGPSATHPALTEVTTSTHYIIRTAPGDNVDASWQDQYYVWVLGALELQPSGRLEYHKYRDRAHLEALTGRDTNGFAEPGTARFHTIWPTDNHEGVHTLVLLQIGHPPALFNEGRTSPIRALARSSAI